MTLDEIDGVVVESFGGYNWAPTSMATGVLAEQVRIQQGRAVYLPIRTARGYTGTLAAASIVTGEEIPVLPSNLSWEVVEAELSAELTRSERLLMLEPNWDGEDSPGYTPEVLDRARHLIELTVKQLFDQPRVEKVVPSIDAGPNGSIDVYWQNADRELLVNIPAAEGELAEFYGTDDTGAQVKGKLDPGTAQGWLVAWIAK
ncbi:MAG TPA: hypothetical protein VGE45_08290 [Chloroflexia bacterium]|jgi:hypothetical protein